MCLAKNHPETFSGLFFLELRMEGQKKSQKLEE